MIEVIKSEWKDFFANLSGEFDRWQTSIGTMNGASAKMLVIDKSSFVGIAAEIGQNSQITIELMGGVPYKHQTHTVYRPRRVLYQPNGRSLGRLIAVEDETGATTFINLKKPPPPQTSAGENPLAAISYWQINKFL